MRILGSTAFGSEDRQSRDYYATDPSALEDFLTQFLEDGEILSDRVWEPACGDGNLYDVLNEVASTVRCSDIYDYGDNEILDFLSVSKRWNGDILTNPPYKQAKEFVQNALNIIPKGNKVMMLLRIQFLESSNRLSFFKKHPPKYVYVHSRRIRIFKDNDQAKYTKAQPLCYAWFVWEKGFEGEPRIRWIP